MGVVGQGHYAGFYVYQQGSHNYPTAFKFESTQDTAVWIDYYAQAIHINIATFYNCTKKGEQCIKKEEQAPSMIDTLDYIKYLKNTHGSKFVLLSIQEYSTITENQKGLPLTFTHN
jgi:hypothetical protein